MEEALQRPLQYPEIIAIHEHVRPSGELNRDNWYIRRWNITPNDFCDKQVQTPTFEKSDLMLFLRPDL